jgi:hypothetical protein
MNPTKGVPPLLVAQADPERDERVCHWFLGCEDETYADVDHPTLGWVPVCHAHLDWLLEDAHGRDLG